VPAGIGALLVDTEWLAERLDDPHLRILDYTVEMRKQPDGSWRANSGRSAYESGYVPNALFVDLLLDLKDNGSALDYMLPPAEQFAGTMEFLGIGNHTRVVLYTAAVPWWATRMWWMLRVFGHDNVAVITRT
jgi:thiosulfate/3-mercaptopyruvate sulfurtransferase